MKILGYTVISKNELRDIIETNENLQQYISSGAMQDPPSELLHLASNLDWDLRNILGYRPSVSMLEDRARKTDEGM